MSIFGLGRIVATPGALDRARKRGIDLAALLHRHASGDWGDVDAQDKRTNQAALKDGSRILSSYGSSDLKIWIITDAETDACPACHGYGGECEPDKGEHLEGMHFRTDVPMQRLTTTILRPEDY